MKFNQCYNTYDFYTSPQQFNNDFIIQKIKDYNLLKANKTALEFGAGTGYFTKKIDFHFQKYIATDLYKEMILAGKTNTHSSTWLQLNAFNISPYFMKFFSNKFDYIFSTHLLQWSKNPIHVLSNWKKLLSTYGIMCFSIFIKGTLDEAYTLIPSNAKPIEFLSHQEWLNYFKELNLDIIFSYNYSKIFYYPTSLHFFKSLHKSGVTNHPVLNYNQTKSILKKYDTIYKNPYGVYSTWNTLSVALKKKDVSLS